MPEPDYPRKDHPQGQGDLIIGDDDRDLDRVALTGFAQVPPSVSDVTDLSRDHLLTTRASPRAQPNVTAIQPLGTRKATPSARTTPAGHGPPAPSGRF